MENFSSNVRLNKSIVLCSVFSVLIEKKNWYERDNKVFERKPAVSMSDKIINV